MTGTTVAARIRSRAGRARGFTLIELMIAVAVIAILAAIAYPAYQEQVRKSRRAQAKADLVELAQMAERHYTVNSSYASWTPAFTQSPREGVAHYTIATSGVSPSTFTLTATPTSAAQLPDRCGALGLTNTGKKTHTTGESAECDFGSRP
ncbi:type IV pilin protein [Luteimonas abyssi]|uniref:type IV pilin protein n=1 Tax=Luteimonas abyssi TaxID=1247514 RepID=UPI000737BADD|nr:type IV pilin protein [Luteimonas abyssi]